MNFLFCNTCVNGIGNLLLIISTMYKRLKIILHQKHGGFGKQLDVSGTGFTGRNEESNCDVNGLLVKAWPIERYVILENQAFKMDSSFA